MVSLISISIDSPFAMSWWVVKNVLYGSYCLSYYLIYGSKTQQPRVTREEIMLLELKKELSELDKKIDGLTADNNMEKLN
jgi:hypothetical protein